jgi:hypothetical protein
MKPLVLGERNPMRLVRGLRLTMGDEPEVPQPERYSPEAVQYLSDRIVRVPLSAAEKIEKRKGRRSA